LVALAIDCRATSCQLRRPDEAQDRSLELVDALLDREILDDSLLDLLESVVVGVEHLDRGREILADLALLAPGQREQRVDVVAHDRRLGRHRRHHLELLEFGERLAFRLLRHACGLDLLFHFVEIGVLVALTQLLLDRLHLLIQVVLALALFHLPLHAAADALFDLQDVHLALELPQEMLEALADVAHLEHFLLLLELERQVSRDGVGQAAAVVDSGHRCQDLRWNLLVELYVLVELRKQRTAHRFDLVRLPHFADDRGGFGGKIIAFVDDTVEPPRCAPSTNTFTVPSGSFSICSTVATVPME
jgi:hypothetical protein